MFRPFRSGNMVEYSSLGKGGLGYDNHVFNSIVFDYDELNSSELDVSVPTSPVHDRYQSGEGYHVVPLPYTRTFIPSKPDLVFHDAPTASEIVPNVFYVEPSTTKPTKEMSQSNRPSAPIIEVWVSNSEYESEGEPMPTQKAPSFVQTFEHVKTPRTSIKPVEHPTQAENIRKDILKSKGHKHSWNRKACFVCKSLNHLIKDFDFYEKQMVQKPVRNHAIGVNHQNSTRMTHPHSDKHVVPTVVLTRSRLVPLNVVRPVTTVVHQTNVKHQRVPRENNMYNVDLKNIVPSGDLTCLFAKVTLKESNLWHRRLGHINFKIMNKLVKGNLVRGLPSKVFENNPTYVACKKGKQHRASCKTKPVLLTKPHNKTPYELLLVRTPSIGFMRPFRCPITILNTLDPLEKFNGKADEGFLVGYSVSSKAFRVFNSKTRIVQETLHINFLENQPNVARNGPTWLFDIDTLTQSMSYQPVIAENQPNCNAGIQGNFDAGKVMKEAESAQQYMLLPLCSTASKDSQNTDVDDAFDDTENESEVHVSPSSSDKLKKHDEKAKREAKGKSHIDLSTGVRDLRDEFEEFFVNNTNGVNAASIPVTAIGPNSTNCTNSFNAAGPFDNNVSLNFEIDDEEDVGVEADFSNLETSITVSPIPTTRVHKDHPVTQIIGFVVYQMDVKSDFLYETIEKKVYVCQPLGFEDPDYPDMVYKVYVDDNIFGFTNKELCKAFEKLMKDKFQTSSMGELTFFLGLQVKQKDNGIFISQDKYIAEILRKFGLTDGKSASTPIDTEKPLLKDPDGEDVDIHIYIVKRIFRYLKGKPHLSLWYPKDSPFNLVAYSDSDYAGASLDRKSTTGGSKIHSDAGQEGKEKEFDQEYILLPMLNTSSDVPLSNEEVVSSSKDDAVKKSTVEPTCVDRGKIDDLEEGEDNNEVSAATLPSPTLVTTPPPPQHEPIPSPPQAQSTQPSSPPQKQPTQPTDISKSLMNLLNKLMATCATLTQKVANLEQDKIAQALEIVKLKQRVRKLEKKRRTKHSRLKRGTAELDADDDVNLVDVDVKVEMDTNIQGRMAESQAKAYNLDLQHSEKVLSMQDTDEAEPAEVEEVLEVVTAAKLMIEVVTTAAPITTAAQVPKASAPRKRRGVVIQDPEEIAATSVNVHSEVWSKDKGKGILIEEPKPLKGQAYIDMDEAFARQLEAELNANINWNEVIEQVKRKERKDNEVMRYQALKRKPLTEAHERKNMMIYLKNMAGFKMNFFKGMTYNEIRPLFEKHYNLNQDFLERVEEEFLVKEKEIEEEGSKRKDYSYDDDVYTKATPLASKVPVVDYQIHHENNKPYYKIIKADGTHKLSLSFITLLKNFDREDLETLWMLVKERFKSIEPTNFSDDFLLNTLKIMFEKTNVEPNV
nr:hypothetical protein [Tanacetum cinerariifolium]